MAHILAFDQIDNVLAHVFRVIADAFQRLGDRQDFQRGGDGARVFHHERDQLADDGAVFLVHCDVGAYYLSRGCHIETGKCVQRAAQHVYRQLCHVAHFVEARQMEPVGFVDHLAHAGDFFRLVADTLQIGGGLDHRHHHAQIGCGRLAAGNDVLAHFVDHHVEAVDAAIFLDHFVHHFQIAAAHCFNGVDDLLFHQSAHLQHTRAYCFQFGIELLVYVFLRHCVSPQSDG